MHPGENRVTCNHRQHCVKKVQHNDTAPLMTGYSRYIHSGTHSEPDDCHCGQHDWRNLL